MANIYAETARDESLIQTFTTETMKAFLLLSTHIHSLNTKLTRLVKKQETE
jgi:hypothetical protein